MKKYSFWVLVCCLTVLLVSCNDSEKKNAKTTTKSESTGNSDKPNIIYILADDLGYGDLSVYGQKKFKTPNIDKLASQGMLFTQHYSGSTVCAPSRSALLTGMHTGHTAVRGNKEVMPEGQYPIPDKTYTLAEAMGESNYVTGAFGKWGLGFPRSQGDPINQGFDVFFGYNCQRMGHNYYPDHLWSNGDSIVLDKNLHAAKQLYAPELIHQKTLSFIEDNKDKPFFLYVASVIPHAELAAPEKAMEKFRGKFPAGKQYKGVADTAYGTGGYASQKEPRTAFAAMISVLDRQVGGIMEKIEELGIAENTIVIFTSDNGPHIEGGADPEFFNSNGPLRGAKRDLYEGGIRVPMIARWPNKIAEGSTSQHVSAFWDVLPTFMDILGREAPDNLDGVSFLPTLLGDQNKQVKHEYLYWEFHEKGGRQAVRKGKWKAVKYNVLKDANAPLELYDLSQDIGEDNNVAHKFPEIVAEMETILSQARSPSDVFTFDQKTDLNVD